MQVRNAKLNLIEHCCLLIDIVFAFTCIVGGFYIGLTCIDMNWNKPDFVLVILSMVSFSLGCIGIIDFRRHIAAFIYIVRGEHDDSESGGTRDSIMTTTTVTTEGVSRAFETPPALKPASEVMSATVQLPLRRAPVEEEEETSTEEWAHPKSERGDRDGLIGFGVVKGYLWSWRASVVEVRNRYHYQGEFAYTADVSEFEKWYKDDDESRGTTKWRWSNLERSKKYTEST